jgi:hypothetical protein
MVQIYSKHKMAVLDMKMNGSLKKLTEKSIYLYTVDTYFRRLKESKRGVTI